MRKRNEQELQRNFPCMSCGKLSRNAKKEANGSVGSAQQFAERKGGEKGKVVWRALMQAPTPSQPKPP